MRFIIIGLSFVFFTLSAIITFTALDSPIHTPLADMPLTDIPLVNAPYRQDNQKDTSSESNNATQNITENQITDSTVAKNLEAPIAQLEDKSTIPEKTTASVKTADSENHPRILTVFGGQTFRSGQDIIHDAAISKIEKLVSEISVFPNSLILIEGHTDNIPTGKLHKDNMDLSVRRARTIANTLISRGIPQERISVIGYGDTRPINTNTTEEGRAKNRRVEVKLMLKEGGN